MRNSDSRKSRAYGRRGNKRHVRLDFDMIDSGAWADLSATARSLYVDIKRQYTGFNDTRITVPTECRRGAYHGTMMAAHTYSRTVRMLEDKGFIDIYKLGALSAGGNRAYSEFGLSERWRKYGTEDYQKPTRPHGQWRSDERKK